MILSLWHLMPAAIVPPMLLNLRQWRRDLKRIDGLAAPPANPRPLRDTPPRVSFLVAAWNEESRIRACIQAILGLSYPDFEVVLCAGGTDRTWQVASQLEDPRLILLEQRSGEGQQRSLQRCFERATGDILYLLDADCLITDAAFACILDPILSHGEEAVTGGLYPPVPGQLSIPFVVSQCACRVYTSIYQPEYSSGLSGANSAIRRGALEQAGAFKAQARTGGDYDLGKRLRQQGTRIRYEVRAAVPSEFHTQVRAYLRQQARWLRNVVTHGIRFGAYREVLACLYTSLVGLAMLVIPCLGLALAWYAGSSSFVVRLSAAIWVFGFSYAIFSRLRYLNVALVWLGIRVPRRVLALLPFFLLIDFLAWTIPLGQYQTRSWRERW